MVEQDSDKIKGNSPNATLPAEGEKPDNKENQEEKNPIDEAKEILAENKKILEELREERKKLEKATAQIMMSGKGRVLKEEKKEETDAEYSERIRKGIL